MSPLTPRGCGGPPLLRLPGSLLRGSQSGTRPPSDGGPTRPRGWRPPPSKQGSPAKHRTRKADLEISNGNHKHKKHLTRALFSLLLLLYYRSLSAKIGEKKSLRNMMVLNNRWQFYIFFLFKPSTYFEDKGRCSNSTNLPHPTLASHGSWGHLWGRNIYYKRQRQQWVPERIYFGQNWWYQAE